MVSVIGMSGRDRLAVCRTTGCREQPISDQGGLERVLQTASRSLPLARPRSRTRNVNEITWDSSGAIPLIVVQQVLNRLVVQVLRVVGLGEEEPALRQQSGVLNQECSKQQAGGLCSEPDGHQ